MNKVLLTATVQSHICQFHRPLVELLHAYGYEVHVAAKDNLAEKNGLKLDFADKVYNLPFSRSPKSTDNIKAYKELKKIIENEHYDIIHCNTPMGSIVTRLAAKKSRKNGTKVFYTAHGFHFYNGASRKNWLVFYPIEKIMSRFCDKLITVNEEDYKLAKAKFPCNVAHIHGVGVSTERYHTISENEKVQRLRAEGLQGDEFTILCTGELNENKDQKTLIAAAANLKGKISNLKILLAGNGPLEHKLKAQVSELGLDEVIKFLGYRTDLFLLTPAVDLIVSCSHREGMPLNILEAMLCKKTVIAAENRGHNELVENGRTGYLVNPSDVDALTQKIYKIYKSKDNSVDMGNKGFDKAQAYTTNAVKKELASIYDLEF
ncbi:MAG: glycosyltransferase family 4 protein [Ruminococcus sp.]|nr:glycosyltransferase family 4 protein [Ruminococcus sp.]